MGHEDMIAVPLSHQNFEGSILAAAPEHHGRGVDGAQRFLF